MLKRKAEYTCDTSYVVIETVEGDGDVLVSFIPSIWLQTKNKDQPITTRQACKFYYPRRLEKQSKDQFLKLVRRAKFECEQPKTDNKWDLLDCRVLRIGIDSFTDAKNAEKLFSDFFNTTDVEKELNTQTSTKRIRKIKKAAFTKNAIESESSDEAEGGRIAQITSISNYNSSFKQPPIDNDNFAIDSQLQGNWNLYSQIDGDEHNDYEPALVIDSTAQETTFEFMNQRKDSSKNDKCNCSQKVLNKIDYFQKKILKEIGRYRKETSQSIRQLNERFDHIDAKSKMQGTPKERSATAEFENQFKTDFPVQDKQKFIDLNEAVKDDRKFKNILTSILKQNMGKNKENETKAVRHILSRLCSSVCLSNFTWGATETKANFSALQSIINMIQDIVEEQFPHSDAYLKVKKVVQQRTKSANASANKMHKQKYIPPATATTLADLAVCEPPATERPPTEHQPIERPPTEPACNQYIQLDLPRIED